MKKYIIYIASIFSIFIFSCSDNSTEKNKRYTISDFFKKYDSSKFRTKEYEGWKEILDTVNITGERGLYKFDKNGTLRFYGYLLNENNDYFFGVEYDSLGNMIKAPKSNVIRWFVSKIGEDSLKLSFLLYGINYSYGKVKIEDSNYLIKVPLFESKYFSNILAGDIIIKKPKKKIVYITGVMNNHWQNKVSNFKDSVIIP